MGTIARLAIVVCVSLGCGASDDRPDDHEDQDEAQIWTLDSKPIMHVGDGLDGSMELQFGYVSGVHQLPGGVIAVMDAWAPALSFFTTAGQFIGKIGREGSGPGEFPARGGVRSFTCGTDSVYVQTLPNVHVFAAPGTFVRTFRIEPVTRIEGCSGSRIIGRGPYGVRREEPGIFTDSTVLHTYGLEGGQSTVLDTVAQDERVWAKGPHEGLGNSRRVFGNAVSIDANSHGFLIGYSAEPEALLFSSAAEAPRHVPVQAWNRMVSDTDVEQFRAFVRPDRYEERERRMVEDQLASATGRELPAYGEVKLDAEGNIWVRQYDHLDAVAFFDHSSFVRTARRPKLEGSRIWKVISPGGATISELATPAGFTLHEIGPDWVLGLWRDEDDVQYVQMYRLRKAPIDHR